MEIEPIPEKVRAELLEMFLALPGYSITFNHSKERVRTNGSGRRHGIADCFDELRSRREECIDELRSQAKNLSQLEQRIQTIERAMANAGIVRCSLCADGKCGADLHEQGILNRGGTGNPITSDWDDCDCCHGEGMIVHAGHGATP